MKVKELNKIMKPQINSNCIHCGACAFECPNEAIFKFNTPYKIAGTERFPLKKRTYYIVPALCSLCVETAGKLLCADICPMNAIV